jgi:hypothetical protein
MFDPTILTTMKNNNLRLLEILHYVYGGIEALGALVVFIIFNVVGAFMSSDFVAQESGDAAPAIVGGAMTGVGWGLSLFILFFAIVNFISARNIARRKGRTFSMVVAGIDCLSFPIGTALGVFTLIELSKDDVKQLYAASV